jgi:hypothetical protein
VTSPDPTQNPEAASLADRISLLQQNHQWMTPQVQTTLAASPTSNQELTQIADSLKQRTASTWDGISHFFDDPVLQKAPTASLALHQYISGAIGASPIAESHISTIQASLQKEGLGRDLDANAVWTPAWQQALQQHAQNLYNKQSSGDKPGSASAGGILHGLLHSLTPSGVASAIGGFIQSIPVDLQQLAGQTAGLASWVPDAIGGVAGEAISGGNNFGKALHDARESARQTDLTVENALGRSAYQQNVLGQGAYTAADERRDTTGLNIVTSTVNNLGAVFLFSGLGKAGSAIYDAAGGGAKDLFTRSSIDAATRGPGVVAKSLIRPVGTRVVAGAAGGGVIGGVTAAATGKDVGAGIGAGAIVGGLTGAALGGDRLPSRAFQNLPVLKNTGPVLGKLLDSDGLYYKARTLAASPYQYGAVRLAGEALAAGQAFSLKAHAVGALEHSLSGSDTGSINQSIQSVHPLDPINASIGNALAFTALGHTFHPDLDLLMNVLHGPVGGAGSITQSLGDTSGTAGKFVNAALQRLGHTAQVEMGTGKSYQDLVGMAGSEDRANLWIGMKVRQHAAYQYAEQEYTNLRAADHGDLPQQFSDDYYNFLRTEANAVWKDPEAMKAATGRLAAPNNNYLSRAIKNEIRTGTGTPEEQLRHGLGAYLDAGSTLTHEVLPNTQHMLLPQEATVIPKGMDPAFAKFADQMETKNYKAASDTPPDEGSIGLARIHLNADGTENVAKSTLTSQQAAKDVSGFKDALDAAGGDIQAQSQVFQQMQQYAHDNYGLDARELSVMAGRPDRMLEILEGRSKTLAAEVHLAKDAPQELVDAFAKIRSQGYRVTVGTDIGHAFRSNLPPLEDLGKQISARRRFVSSIGLNPQSFSRMDFGADRRLRIAQSLQKSVDDGKITLPPYYTVQTVLQDLQDDQITGKQLPYVTNALFGMARKAHQGSINRLVESGAARDPLDAERMLKEELAAAGGLRSLSVKDVRRILTRKDNVPWVSAPKGEDGLVDGASMADRPGMVSANDNEFQLMSQQHADEVFKAIQRGYSQTPTYMLGLQKLEDFARYMPFAVRDAVAEGGTVGGVHVPGIPGVARMTDNQATLAMMNLPNRIAQLRDTYRFNMSPYFSLRRIAKTNVKMGVDGVVPTLNPVKSLVDRDVYKEAHDVLDRVLGKSDPRYKYLDDADRTLHDNDVFGLYNPRHFEAYYAYEKAAAGATDDQIKAGLTRVFEYGKDGVEGRSAAERTANTIFFPFSFEKTVAKNVGGYLLDHPAQTMVLSNALDAYRDFNNHHLNGDNPLAASWYEQHLPLMKELLKLNAFAHGMSPGEFGGVNRPLLNFFMPNSLNSSPQTSSLIERMVPAIKDFKNIYKEGTDQSRIVRQSVLNGYSIITGQHTSAIDARPSNKAEATQRTDALGYRNQLNKAFQQVLDYNNSVGTDEEKYHFPNTDDLAKIGLAGAPITKSNIGLIVHQAYPVYDPTAGALFAIKKKAAAELFVRSRATPDLRAKYGDFLSKAETVVSHLNSDEYPVEQAAAIQQTFRDTAIQYASEDPAFYKFYKATFASTFGPLERVSQ